MRTVTETPPRFTCFTLGCTFSQRKSSYRVLSVNQYCCCVDGRLGTNYSEGVGVYSRGGEYMKFYPFEKGRGGGVTKF